MKFKTGLMSIFMVFIAAVALVTGAGFYRYTNRQYEIQERQTMELQKASVIILILWPI